MWNDTKIQELNPSVASLLPAEYIIVAYITTAQTSVQASMTALSYMVPEFNATVRPPPGPLLLLPLPHSTVVMDVADVCVDTNKRWDR
jgi:hypothetical protein